jgi:nucleoside-diphosphate-sugar epimerase
MSLPGRRVFVTGGTGFVGSYVAEHLRRDRARAVGLLVRPGSDDWRLTEDVNEGAVFARCSLHEPDELRRELTRFKPDTVVHLAWDGVSPADRDSPSQLRNIQASIDLLDIAHEAGAQTFIGMGSQAEYGPHLACIRETDPTRPTTLYGASKLSVCHLSRLFADKRQMRYVWLRLFSTYGPKDHARWLIPYVALTLLRGEKPALTEGRQNWDYVHVGDIADAVVSVVDNSDAEGIYNVGAGRVVTVRRIVERIRDLVDPSAELAFGGLLYRPDQVMHLEADISRLHRATGWAPRIDLDQGLAETVEWYRRNGDGTGRS